ncbi:hypothetical protein AtNW77_Chr1g0042071 [Arabidopsis thaliana]
MHWIVTNLTIETLTKLCTVYKHFFVGFSLFERKWVYESLNTPNTSLTHIISQMLWIMTTFDHRNTNKAIYSF